MTVKEYNEVWWPLINNSGVFLHALEHNIKKAESPEEALSNLQRLGWGPELQKFLEDAVSVYKDLLVKQAKTEDALHTISSPIQIGDVLYSIICCAETPQMFEVTRIQITKEYGLEFGAYSRNQTYRVFRPQDIGKEFFRTIEEAKEALEKKNAK